MNKTTFGLIVGTNGFFNSSLAVNRKKDLVELVGNIEYN